LSDVGVPLWRIVAVVGVSGSGKTSLAIRTLVRGAGFEHPSAGSFSSRRPARLR
jgi:KaiC/GvpD/RAD55 family RecA-like ATPase